LTRWVNSKLRALRHGAPPMTARAVRRPGDIPALLKAADHLRRPSSLGAAGAVVTRPLPLRAEQLPDDTTIVLRGGTMAVGDGRLAAERSFARSAVLGISVEGVIGTTLQDACRSERLIVFRRVRLSTFGRVRAAGFAVLATFERPHFTLVLPDLAELTLARIDRCFDPPIPNPGRAPGR